ncbi:2-hydroxychromene-2-carboxylate isomerase [Sneathiella limimaris]|uniref:2-hydroxychromene-2-carboxylate isomerase n=1 Tax=Sneathiella limimaris TaxID=1964213 RepID=UPI00146F75F0|nr:2-hydroxychromene-2-carboxylate isomerase [Sneathiella limimaris]
MPTTIDYYVSLSSPWTYMGHRRLADMAEKYGAKINFMPVDLTQVFPVTGGLPLNKRAPARQKYRLMELDRWRMELNIPLNIHPKFFPVDSTDASKVCLVAAEEGADAFGLAEEYMKGVWAREQNIADPETIIEIANEFGLNGRDLYEKSQDQKYADRFMQYSKDAIEKGVFGAPSYVIGEEIFWGQDRLNFVEKKLKAGD